MVVQVVEVSWKEADVAAEQLVEPLLDFILAGTESTRVEQHAKKATEELAVKMVGHRVLTMSELAMYAHGCFDGFLQARGIKPF